MKTYQVCTRCIMDTTDPSIRFDEAGVCDHCLNFDNNIVPNWRPDASGLRELQRTAERIRRAGKDRDHDCLIGVSGGADSSYVTYVACEVMGLRPLILHVDTGWNSQEAVNNIERIVDGLGLDLVTEVVDWQEMRDLQLAFFKAGVQHLDTPQDHAIFAGLYNFAAKHGFKYIVTGANYATECIRNPLDWHYHATDLAQLRDIHRRFGSRPLRTFPLTDIFTYKIYYRYAKGIRVVRPLNSVPYMKADAVRMLTERFGWQKYPHKHYESRFTRFYEGYWQPTKFGVDKRRRDFSIMVLTGEMTREEALSRISRPAWDQQTIQQDFHFVATKLGVSVDDLNALMAIPPKSWRDYRNRMGLIKAGTRVMQLLGVEKRAIR